MLKMDCLMLILLAIFTQANGMGNEWTPWGPWGPFDATCGPQTRFRLRKCIIKIPWDECIGDSMSTQVINNIPCPTTAVQTSSPKAKPSEVISVPRPFTEGTTVDPVFRTEEINTTFRPRTTSTKTTLETSTTFEIVQKTESSTVSTTPSTTSTKTTPQKSTREPTTTNMRNTRSTLLTTLSPITSTESQSTETNYQDKGISTEKFQTLTVKTTSTTKMQTSTSTVSIDTSKPVKPTKVKTQPTTRPSIESTEWSTWSSWSENKGKPCGTLFRRRHRVCKKPCEEVQEQATFKPCKKVITQKFKIIERIVYQDEISSSKKINVWSFIQCKMKCQFEPSCNQVAINRLKDSSWDCYFMRTKNGNYGIETWRRKRAFDNPVKVFTKVFR
eukprot:TCONS_00020133-protein